MARIGYEEQYVEEYLNLKVSNIKKVNDTYEVLIDLSGIKSYLEIENETKTMYGGWRRPSKSELQNDQVLSIIENHGGVIPIKNLLITVKYIPINEAKKYNGYYGWIGETDMISFFDRNSVGCQVSKKINCSSNLNKFMEKEYQRTKCEGGFRKLEAPITYINEIREIANNLGEVTGESFYADNNSYCVWLNQKACESLEKCHPLKMKYWPTVHIPFPNSSYLEAGTGITRSVSSAVAGLIAKLLDPGFPNRYGIYKARGLKTPYPIQEELYPSCYSCTHYKYINRGEDEESDLRQPGLPEQKDIFPPIDWCRFHENWITPLTETRFEANQNNLYNQNTIKRSAKESACHAYSWREKMYASPSDTNKYNPVWRNWIQCTKAVIIKNNIITAYSGTNIKVSINLSPKWAEAHEKAALKINK